MNTTDSLLNRLFTHSVFLSLLRHEENHVYFSAAKKYVQNYQHKTNSEILHDIYNFMSKKYRNEYFYKNTLLTNLLLHRHNLYTTVALTQIPIGKSKADFVLMNGKATVYEIKSELDTYRRLETQLVDYFKAFEHVCVLGPEEDFEQLYSIVSHTPVGLYCLTKRNTISKTLRKEPVAYTGSLSHKSIFKVLHKNEYEAIIQSFYGSIPNSSQVEHYDACLDRFYGIPISIAYKMSIEIMKMRNKKSFEYLKRVPRFLNSVLYFSNPSAKELDTLHTFLAKQFTGEA